MGSFMDGISSSRILVWFLITVLWLGSFLFGIRVAGGLGGSPFGSSQTTVFSSGAFNENIVAVRVHDFLRERGVTPAGAAGVLGNFEQESRFDPAAVEAGSGEGIGLAQWSGTRRDALEAAAQAAGVPWQDLQFQLDFLVAELAADYPAVWRGLMTVQDPVEAAIMFHDGFEKSADSPEKVRSVRGGQALVWLDRFSGWEPAKAES